jgi:hypothetical protein
MSKFMFDDSTGFQHRGRVEFAQLCYNTDRRGTHDKLVCCLEISEERAGLSRKTVVWTECGNRGFCWCVWGSSETEKQTHSVGFWS